MSIAVIQEETESRIIEATLDLLGRVGYKGTTTRQIAQNAKVNEVTLFRRFGSKESLAREATSYAQTQLKKAFEEKKLERTGDVSVDVTSLASSLMEILARRADSVSAILFEARSEPFMHQAAETLMSSALGVAREFFRGYAAELRLNAEDIDSLALSVVSFCFFRVVVSERILGYQLTGGGRKKEFENHTRLLLRGISRSGRTNSEGRRQGGR